MNIPSDVILVELDDQTISIRSIMVEDEDLLLAIYAGTRTEEMNNILQWSDDEKNRFIQQQFYVQHEYYQKVYPNGIFGIICLNGIDIGRLYLNYSPETLRIIDISLLPLWRNKKIGTIIIESLKNEVAGKNISLSIHVESFNPALELYKRLGFEKIKETNGVYWLMEWKYLN
jgi:GNAT superfamily N-acetyltransferase